MQTMKAITIISRAYVFLLLLLVGTTISAQQTWNGGIQHDFEVEGRKAIVVEPERPAPGRPWIWRPAFFNAFPSVDIALLKEGWHVAYYDVTHLYGSPGAVKLSESFYDYVTEQFNLSKKVTVEGFSRGGYFAFAWAYAHPETVSSLYVDAPVCDITSWPGRSQAQLWNDFLNEWGVRDEDVSLDFKGNALQLLPKLAEARIPIIAVCGAKDKTVPYEDNFKKVRDAFQAMGGMVELILKPDCDHHPHSLDDPEPVVDFVKRYADGYEDYQSIFNRGGLRNSMTAMAVLKKATVAFFGGSITQMRGWKDMVMEDLKQRFPDTEFTFIDAGIASLGSTPHAFRFEEDVLSRGVPDLLFVEAAVNDDTNYFGPREQVLGMEGIVRHALRTNPNMDIVLLHFIYDPFLPLLEQGEQPDVILNHERVANRYHIPSANLAQEVSSRMQAGQFSWKDFGGTHPAWTGHKFYAAAVSAILDENTLPFSEYAVTSHLLPKPLDEFNYESGRQVPISEAKKMKGFEIVEDWAPDDDVSTRGEYVHIPMLTTDRGGSLTFEFDGRAAGIYCVCGPDAAAVSWKIDGGEWRKTDTHTEWSDSVHLPWVYMFAENLSSGHHILQIRVPRSGRSGCHIKSFVVND